MKQGKEMDAYKRFVLRSVRCIRGVHAARARYSSKHPRYPPHQTYQPSALTCCQPFRNSSAKTSPLSYSSESLSQPPTDPVKHQPYHAPPQKKLTIQVHFNTASLPAILCTIMSTQLCSDKIPSLGTAHRRSPITPTVQGNGKQKSHAYRAMGWMGGNFSAL